MSELQIGLIVAGVLIVLAVYAYNRFQERQFRRRMESKFNEQPLTADPLLDTDVERAEPAERLEPHLGAAVPDEPPASAAVEPPQVPEPVEEPPPVPSAPFVPPPAVTSTRAAAPVAATIDYSCLVEAAEPIPHDSIADFVRGAGAIGKPVQLQGWSIRSNEWIELPCAPEIPLVRVQAALQLADRSGPANRVQLSTLRDLVHQLAEEAGVACDCPDIDAASHKAAELDRFCAQVDISIGCNLLPNGSGGLSGTKLRGLLESAGFTLEPTGRFALRSEDGILLMTAENIEEDPLTGERLRASPLRGLMFSIDVPKVPAQARAFDRMMELGRHLAHALDAVVVDDNRAPLTEAGLKVIRQQLRSVHVAMEQHGIPAGSAVAARLFS
jgi:hypothetical protein